MTDNSVKYELLLINRSELIIGGVISIDSFDEDYLEIDTKLGRVSVEGEGLKIEEFIQNSGKIKINGKICGFFYRGENKKAKRRQK